MQMSLIHALLKEPWAVYGTRWWLHPGQEGVVWGLAEKGAAPWDAGRDQQTCAPMGRPQTQREQGRGVQLLSPDGCGPSSQGGVR